MNKNRKSKITSLILVLAMCCGLLAGCGGSGGTETKEKEKVTLIIKVPTLVMNSISKPDLEDAGMFMQAAGEAFAKQYREADVTFKVEVFEYTDEVKAITGSFDTEDAADVLFEGYFNMASYIHTGRVVPLDDIISDELRKDIDDASWAMSMTGGKTYMMPFSSMQNILFYNKKLFQSCGLEKYFSKKAEIQSWTMEEWTDVLDTLAEKLPKRAYPLTMYGKNNQGDTHIMSLIRGYGSKIFDENGNFNFQSTEAVRALKWIQDGVKKGWYPPHAENLEITDSNELFSNKQLAIQLFNNANLTLYDNIEDYGFVNFPGDVATSFVTGFEVFDNGSEAKQKAAKAFVRYIYDTEEWLEVSAGNIPASKTVSKKYEDQITMLKEFTENADHVVDFMNNSPNWQGDDTSVRSVFWPHIHDLLAGTTTPEKCAKALDEACNGALETGRKNSKLHG